MKLLASNANAQNIQTITYQTTDENILNPERGFYAGIDLWKDINLSNVRSKGYTLARSYIRLDNFRNQVISEDFLQELRNGLSRVREAGIKIIPRISYNFPMASNNYDRVDAPLPWVLNHIQQLKPIFEEYQDVITALPAGFIGAWGEWHSSTNGLDNPTSKKQVMAALLDALPSTRMLQLRYPSDINAFYPNPLDPSEAFNETDQARIGHENLCFLANKSDAGTYEPTPASPNLAPNDLQGYLETISRYVVIGGETCEVTPQSARTDSETALAEMRRFHWSYINVDFYTPIIERWKNEGNFATIANKLGYRLRLIQSQIPESIKRGDNFNISFTITNDGFASPYNPRKTEIILRNRESKQVYRFPVNVDPRRWLADGNSYQVNFNGSTPADMPTGNYEVLLSLPDPMPQLYERPEYSIRLANQNVWDAPTGYNSLLANVLVN